VHVVWGDPIDAGSANASPSDAEVQAVFGRYVAELRRIFEKHAARCLPPEVAARGLQIEVRDPSPARKGNSAGGGADSRSRL
jgi:hypothetical protein